jgi:hypothetical protein
MYLQSNRDHVRIYVDAFHTSCMEKGKKRDRLGHDRMVVGFTTTYAISARASPDEGYSSNASHALNLISICS